MLIAIYHVIHVSYLSLPREQNKEWTGLKSSSRFCRAFLRIWNDLECPSAWHMTSFIFLQILSQSASGLIAATFLRKLMHGGDFWLRRMPCQWFWLSLECLRSLLEAVQVREVPLERFFLQIFAVLSSFGKCMQCYSIRPLSYIRWSLRNGRLVRTFFVIQKLDESRVGLYALSLVWEVEHYFYGG